jgi:hypothetical protein
MKHAPECAYHVDQYDWECTCAAQPDGDCSESQRQIEPSPPSPQAAPDADREVALVERLRSEAVNWSATCGDLFDEAADEIERLRTTTAQHSGAELEDLRADLREAYEHINVLADLYSDMHSYLDGDEGFENAKPGILAEAEAYFAHRMSGEPFLLRAPAQHVARDAVNYGIGAMKDGERIAPEELYDQPAPAQGDVVRAILEDIQAQSMGVKPPRHSWYYDKAADALKALATLPPSMGGERGDEWQPFSTAPKDGTPFLCFVPDPVCSPETGMDVIWWEPTENAFLLDDNPILYTPSHWMPLPNAPGATPMPVERGKEGAKIWAKVSEEARRYAGHYKPSSDGWNTFLMFANWADEQAAAPTPSASRGMPEALPYAALLAIRDALVEGDPQEAYHQLRMIADPDCKVSLANRGDHWAEWGRKVRALAAPQSSRDQIHESPLANVRSTDVSTVEEK